MDLEVMKIMPIIRMDYTNEVYILNVFFFKFMSSCIFSSCYLICLKYIMQTTLGLSKTFLAPSSLKLKNLNKL
jgi:hypothetical protein